MTSEPIGWLVNDCLTCIPGTKTFWHDLLNWFPGLRDMTGGYTDYSILANAIEQALHTQVIPRYIIRNGSYFRSINSPSEVSTISLIQDIMGPGNQDDVINSSDHVVFNSNYVYKKYLSRITSDVKVHIIPLGVDFDFFKPIDEKHPAVLPNSVLFIGSSSTYPKGFDALCAIMRAMPEQNFCLILKDQFTNERLEPALRSRVRIFNRVDQNTVRLIINSCSCAICTSYEETQHLSGIECGACDLPIVARAVGIYDDCRNEPLWGLIAANNDEFINKIRYILNHREEFSPRQCFIGKYSTTCCRHKWRELIEKI